MNKERLMKKLKSIGLDVISIKFMNLGTSKNNFIIKTPKEKYVLKLYRKNEQKEIQTKINIMKKINEKEIISICPIHPKVLTLGFQVGYVYKFIEGKPFRKIKIKNKLYAFGKVVGKFNRLTKKVMPQKLDSTYVVRKNREAKKTVNYLEGKQNQLHKISKSLLEAGSKIIYSEYMGYKFRTQLIHGDLHDGNVFSEKGKYIILDMEDLSNSILARDFSTTASYLVQSSMVKYKKDIHKFLSGYESEYKLTKKEKEHIPILMLIRKFGEIMYILSQEQDKTLSPKEVKYFLGHSVRKLSLLIKNYAEIKGIFR